ncbi:MAG: hypothetical protein JSR82_01475 [Verrucomicrobia bacterium]|nr:hypothetical protein [Verrucomicrobiota bacterium]
MPATDRSAARLALALCLVVAAGFNLLVTALRLEPAWPLTPWESALFSEGWRWSHGLPVYDPSRATHLYGPLLTVLLAGLEKAFGFDFFAARVTFTLLGVAACAWFARLILPQAGRGFVVVAAVTLCSVNLQTGLSFPLSWADMPALLCSVAAYAALARPHVGPLAGVTAALLLLAAVFCKQTFGLVAGVFVLLWIFDRSWRERAGLWLLLPLAAVLTALAMVHWLAPVVWQQMVVIPSSIRLSPERAADGLIQVARGHPLCWLALGWTCLRPLERTLWSEGRAWIVVGAALLAGCTWTYAKAGGYYNSLLPMHLFLHAVALRLLHDGWRRDPDVSERSWGLLAVAFLCSTLGGWQESRRLLDMTQGDATRAQWIERARQLPGRVICPEEPALALQAGGYAGLSLYFELDAGAVDGNWPAEPPPRILRELEDARWLLTVRASYPTVLTPGWLQSHGWRPVPVPGEERSIYTLWARP